MFNNFLKKEAATGGILLKKVFFKISQTSQKSTTCCWVFLIKLQAFRAQVFKKRLQHNFFHVKFTKFLRTSANGCFWRGSIKKLFLKTYYIHRTKVVSDKCSANKVFLVVDRVMKVSCFYIDQHL